MTTEIIVCTHVLSKCSSNEEFKNCPQFREETLAAGVSSLSSRIERTAQYIFKAIKDEDGVWDLDGKGRQYRIVTIELLQGVHRGEYYPAKTLRFNGLYADSAVSGMGETVFVFCPVSDTGRAPEAVLDSAIKGGIMLAIPQENGKDYANVPAKIVSVSETRVRPRII